MIPTAMPSPILTAFERATVGRSCEVSKRECDWDFTFGGGPSDGCAIAAQTFWRVVAGGRIVVTSKDDGHRFGLPAPLDAEEVCQRSLRGGVAISVDVDPVTGDIAIRLDNDTRLDILTTSSGYESWQAFFRDADQDVTLVGAGGGELSFVSEPAGSNAAVVVGHPLPSS